MREVVAAGRDPRTTLLREIAEEPNATIESDMPLDEAFHVLEEHDLERVPVVEGGKLVGVLSRADRAAPAGRGRAAGRARRRALTRRTPELARVRPPAAPCRRGRLDLVDERCDGCVELVVVSSSISAPSSNFSAAWPTASSPSTTRAPIAPSTLRSSACAQTAPKTPALEPITATGLLRNAFVASGREAQSSAFLSAPGIGRVVLRRRDQHGVGLARPRAEAATAAGAGSTSSSWS